MDAFHPDLLVFKHCSIQQIKESTSYIYQNPAGPSWPGEPTKCVWLPYLEEAKIVLEKYLSDITYTHHVVHSPSVRRTINELYGSLDQPEAVRPGQIALLLSILASATYSWTSRDAGSLFFTPEQANSQSLSWIKAALDVLDYSRRKTAGSLEDIQAMIILSFLVSSLEGFSRRYRDLITTAISSARLLSLHRIDDPSLSAHNTVPQVESVAAEIGRRVWWYLVATECQVTEMDAAFEDFIEGIPAFFKLDSAGLEQIPKTDTRRSPGITVQRYILNSLMYAHRCKLHLHYLGREPEDPMRIRSREKCLSSARIIIRTERILEKEDIPFVLTRFKFSGVLFCIFMAVIVLLLDVCLDEGAQHDEARKAEVADAFSILEEARKQSPIAVKLIESLMSVVRKHKVSLPTSNSLQNESRPPSTEDIGIVTPATTDELGAESGTSNLSSQGLPDSGLSCLDEIWQSFDGQMDFDTIFSALDAQFN
ncbi:hypothetical protein G7Y79_00040g076360 [Physcia stellaris]|nr:hypothetical protein G7Y79_00040g076360 [Physcia stellaris]